MSNSSDKPKFDPVLFFSKALAYAKHIKLMLLMLAFGLLIGIVVFMFTTPTYSSVSLISVNGFGAPIINSGVAETTQRGLLTREFLSAIRSSHVQVETAKRMGLVGEGATSEALVEIIPSVLLLPVDARTIEITVLAYDPAVVRTFAKELVATYQDQEQKNYQEYRNEALVVYAEQVKRLEDEISQTVASLSSLERDQNLTEVTIEQRSLLEIPKELIQTRERLARMKDVRSLLTKLEDQAATPGMPTANSGAGGDIGNMISLLSLLGSFEEQTQVKVGDVASSTLFSSSVRPTKGQVDIDQIIAPSDVDSLEPWRKLEKERRILLNEIKQNSEIYLPEHRVIQDLKTELAATERALETEFNILRQKFDLEYANLEGKKVRLEARLPEYHAVTEELGKSSYAYEAITAKQKMWDTAREALSAKLAVVAFSDDYNWVELRYKGLVSLRDKIPVSPNKVKIAMIALLLGLAGAFGVPTALNVLNTSSSTVADLERVTGMSGIGIVPLTPKGMLEDVTRSPAQGATVPNYLLECFRVIRANIIMRPNKHNMAQVVLVTSARPQEGKTTQAANLAWAFNSMGEKTLLLDCDLRRGRVHTLVNINKSPGMTRLLLGECTKEEAIQSLGPDSFDVIPRGQVIAGTTDLLNQPVFQDLITCFRKTYDRIVIDAPPVLGLSETSSLQKNVDGTVLVVRAEKTGRKDVMDAIAALKRSHANFFGFVLNAVDLSKLGNYYNYYYYSATYYDQFEEEEEEPTLLEGKPGGKRWMQSEL